MTTDAKKIVLLALAQPARMSAVETCVSAVVDKATIYKASDTVNAKQKFENAIPTLLITETESGKMNGIKLIEQIQLMKEAEHTSFIILGPLPEHGHFLDHVVNGRLQYVESETNLSELAKAITQAFSPKSQPPKNEIQLLLLAAGQKLIKLGDLADYVYLVKKGQLRATRTAGGVEVLLGNIETGEFVGEMAYINGEPRNANVSAVTDCELIQVLTGTFEQILLKKPLWAKALMATLAKRVKNANDIRT